MRREMKGLLAVRAMDAPLRPLLALRADTEQALPASGSYFMPEGK